MTALRFVLIVVMTLAATQIAAADTKKSKSSTGSIEVNSYSWGVTNAGSYARTNKGKANASSPVGKTGGKH